MKNRWLMVLAGIVVSSFGSVARSDTRPNIIVVLADDLGWGDLGCYPKGEAWGGEAHIPTPNLDRLASEGVRCTSGYATSMVCAPSRAGLLTGRNQQHLGYFGFEETMAPFPETPKFPEPLRNAGYQTGMIGKWHVSFAPGSHPMDFGFERFFGFLGGEHDYFEANQGQPIHHVNHATDAYVYDQTQPVKTVKYLTHEFTDQAIKFIQSSSEKKRPFFLYLPYSAPHPPMQVPWEALKPYAEKRSREKFTGRDIARAMIEVLDQDIGRLLQYLAENGLDKNTLIIFSSDNGGHDEGPSHFIQHNGGLRARKGYVYEGGIRVPFIVKWPGHIPAGTVYSKPVTHLDLFPTALAAAGLPQNQWPKELEGVDLIPFLNGEKTGDPHEKLFWSMESSKKDWAVREGKWKLVNEDIRPLPVKKGSKPTFETQLYDIDNDPFEQHNVYKEYPEVVSRLEASMKAFHQSMAPSIYTPEIDEAHKKNLKEREKNEDLEGWPRADGSPGHWSGAGAKFRK